METNARTDHIISLYHVKLLKTKSKEKSLRGKAARGKNQLAREQISDPKSWRPREAARPAVIAERKDWRLQFLLSAKMSFRNEGGWEENSEHVWLANLSLESGHRKFPKQKGNGFKKYSEL